MNILQLCNKIPYPPYDGGAIAMLNMSKSLANNGHRVTVLAMSTAKHSGIAVEIPGELADRIQFIYINVDTGINIFRLLTNLIFSVKPYHAVRFADKGFMTSLTQLLQRETFDIIQLEGLYLKPCIPAIRKYHKGLLAYRAHNVESEIWIRIAASTRNSLKRLYLMNLAKRLSAYEKDMVNRYDLLIPISPDDYNWFQSAGNSKPGHLTPTGISDEDFNPPVDRKSIPDLFYIGALDWIPNQEALLWFISQVWLPLKKEHPDLSFHIAGRNAPLWLIKKFRAARVNFHGEIENAHAFMDMHTVMVVPLFAGSGLRIKIVEAMARSKAVIATAIGVQGMSTTPGKEILIANTAGEFLGIIENLLDNPSRVNELQKNAWTFARQNFSNDHIVKNLLYFYMQHTAC